MNLICEIYRISRADVLITIDKSAQRMTVAVDGAMRWRWRVSTGARGYDTPRSGSVAHFDPDNFEDR
jgi:hypothetical protein